MRHRFRVDHAVAFVKGWQDEGIRRPIGARDRLRRALAGEGDAPRKTGARNHLSNAARRRWIALE